MAKKISLLSICLLIFAVLAAKGMDTRTQIFDPSFRTLTVNVEGDRLASPVLTLGGEEHLVIGFDQLSDERMYLRYSILYCNADWQPSDLTDDEVFDNFNYADVDNYAFSRATTVHYVHYRITLPNDQYRFRLSGNYLLRVYPEENPDDILLQVRFMVQEASAKISGSVTSRTDYDFNGALQQLSLDIDTRQCGVRDLNTDLRVVVTQNNRPDRRVTLLHPTRTMGTRAIYEHDRALVFPAANEYRRFETVNNLYPGMGTDHIEYHAPYYHHILNLDRQRASHEYRYDQTQRGRFFIREYNSDASDTEADYVVTHFTLDHGLIPDADIYLDGDFLYRLHDASSRMEYEPSTGRYAKTLLLKQGAYNYLYTVGSPSSSSTSLTPTTADTSLHSASSDIIEGDKYQTVNEYTVAVYYRTPTSRADRLLGFATLFSGR